VRIYSVNTAIQPRLRGLWSPVAVQVEYLVRVKVLVRGEEAAEQLQVNDTSGQAAMDRAMELFIVNMVSLEGEHKALRTLKPIPAQASSQKPENVWRSAPVVTLEWLGILNDALVVLAGALAVISLTGWRTWKQRRDARVLRALKCPGCGYGLDGLRERTCPECGAQFVNEQTLTS